MSLALRICTPWPLMPATQSALSACCALAPKPDESARKCEVGEQSSKCQKPEARRGGRRAAGSGAAGSGEAGRRRRFQAAASPGSAGPEGSAGRDAAAPDEPSAADDPPAPVPPPNPAPPGPPRPARPPCCPHRDAPPVPMLPPFLGRGRQRPPERRSSHRPGRSSSCPPASRSPRPPAARCTRRMSRRRTWGRVVRAAGNDPRHTCNRAPQLIYC